MTAVSRHPSVSALRCVLALALSLGTPATVLGAAGDLDPTFGSGGRVVTDFAGNQDQVSALVLQPDGKLVAAGRTSTGSLVNFSASFDFGLARYNPDGSLDTSFGIGGKVSTDFAGDFDGATALVLQPDGKLVAAGLAIVGARAIFALARYHSDGCLDASFGAGGKVTTDFGGDDNRPFALVLQPDGKLVAAGSAVTASSEDFALVRYHSNGSLDTSFGIGGKLTTGFGGSDSSQVHALLLQPDGKLVAAGYAFFTATSMDFALARYEPTGGLDTAFGTGGKLTTNFDGVEQVTGLVLQPDGKLVAGGSASSFENGGNNFALARYNANGSLDTSFGDGGRRTTGFPGGQATLTALILQPNGKLVAAGWALTDPDVGAADFALARYDSSGNLDPAFGTGGKVLTDFANPFDVASALVRQPDGKLIAAGFTDSISDFAIARYLVEPNAPPVANAGSYPAKQCTAPAGTLVSLDGSASFDPDGDPITYSWTGPFGAASGASPTVAFPLGTHSIALTVSDGASSSTPASTLVTVIDTNPPEIATLFARPSRLGPPNHKMVPVTVSVSAADACSVATRCRIVSVASNEPVSGPDDNTAPDWRITGDLTVDLRAERADAGTGRVYTITVQCTDASGNQSSKALTVSVPRG
jgi:uncharacterized delta-60 repeat protein